MNDDVSHAEGQMYQADRISRDLVEFLFQTIRYERDRREAQVLVRTFIIAAICLIVGGIIGWNLAGGNGRGNQVELSSGSFIVPPIIENRAK